MYLDNTSINNINAELTITGSKSESNRLLILQKYIKQIAIHNLATADDTVLLTKALASNEPIINISHAGTAMRFLTAYFSTLKGKEVIITGSKRMQERPIKILVNALTSIGANITYLDKKGFPPLKIIGQELTKNDISIKANVSSQYISALLLIAPFLKKGLTLELRGEVTSTPYINMTLALLHQIGVKTIWNKQLIKIYSFNKVINKTITVESDWSAASYYYSLVALSKKAKLKLSYFKENSLQGDRDLVAIYANNFGVKTTFIKHGILIEKILNFNQKKHIKLNLINTPDIAQTIAVTCVGLGISCGLEGLHTLKIKETDRLEALKKELQKFNCKVRITDNSIHLMIDIKRLKTNDQKPITINTYNDHRMAMAFAPLSLKYAFTINNPEVVSKSYPEFWQHFNQILNN